MDYSTIIKLIGEIIGAIIAGVFVYIAPKLKAWLSEKVGNDKAEALYSLIVTLVEAAEQQFSTNDPDGTLRKAYVTERLLDLGYAFTGNLNAQIESAVYELNYKKKAVK